MSILTQKVVQTSYSSYGLDAVVSASSYPHPAWHCSVYENQPDPFVYNSYGVTCAEVELDVLTGQTEILRVDILYDCGDR